MSKAQVEKLKVKPNHYQPSKAEKEEELDMPEASIETVRSAFFRRIEIKNKES